MFKWFLVPKRFWDVLQTSALPNNVWNTSKRSCIQILTEDVAVTKTYGSLGMHWTAGLKKFMDWLCYVPPNNISELTLPNDGNNIDVSCHLSGKLNTSLVLIMIEPKVNKNRILCFKFVAISVWAFTSFWQIEWFTEYSTWTKGYSES